MIIFFLLAEQNDSQNVIQNIKKICTDSSSDEMNVKKQLLARTTDILDPAFKLPFKYGWKRELVSIVSDCGTTSRIYHCLLLGNTCRANNE